MAEQKPYVQLSVTGFPGVLQTASWLYAPAVLKVAVAVLATALAAQVRIDLPVTPVPLTLQTLAVLLAGFALGPRLAPVAMLAYLGVGAAGWPVFAPASTGLAGLTGGYLAGFVFAAALVGYLGRGGGGWLRTVAAAVAGTAAIFICGVSWLAMMPGIGWEKAVLVGLAPFVIEAVLKIAVAVAAVQAWRYGSRRPAAR